jgi:predicted nucleotide-binding protein
VKGLRGRTSSNSSLDDAERRILPERKPRILVGSSSEGLPIAKALQEALEDDIELHLWNDSFFTAGEYVVESLEERSRAFDGALVVGTADDRVISRGAEAEAIRDNLLFEFGMFVAIFGRRKAILALEGLGQVAVPSDLFGLTCVGFTRSEPLTTGLTAAITEIRRVVAEYSLDAIEPEVAQRIEEVLRTFIGDLQRALSNHPNVGFHAWIIDAKLSPPRLVRIARSRTSPKAQLAIGFSKGDGLVGECWRTGSPIYVDFSEEPYRSASREIWEDYGPGVRKGMSFELLRASRERYRFIGVAPIISTLSTGTRFLGCVSYNVGPNAGAFAVNPDLAAVEGVLDRVAEVIRIVLES